MKLKNIVFTGCLVTVDDYPININKFKDVIIDLEEKEKINDTVHIFNFTFYNNYLKIKISDGRANPWPDEVYDQEKDGMEPNPRNEQQIEPRDHFIVIDFETSILWTSNSRKKSIIKTFLKNKFKTSDIVFKDVINKEEFIGTIKRINELRFSSTPNLFSELDSVQAALADEINQYGAEEGILHLKYQDKWVGPTLVEKLNSLFNNRNNLTSLTISGRDPEGKELLFNLELISRKIELKALINDHEIFQKDSVFETLTQKLDEEKGINNVKGY
jgi:hypothetical protein